MGGCGSVDKKTVTVIMDSRKGLNYMDEALVTIVANDTSKNDQSTEINLKIDEINKDIGEDLSPEVLWSDPEELMYENIHDVDFLEKDEHSLFREGITGELFKAKFTKIFLKHLSKPINETYSKEGVFKIRKIDLRDLGADQTKLEVRPFQKLDNGVYYFGQWNKETDKREGRGVAVYSDGSFYEGFWQNDLRSCVGRITYPNGNAYQGEWKLDSTEDCYGYYLSKEGILAKGTWVESKLDGKGYEAIRKEFTYHGYFLHGVKEGKGTAKWSDGSKYEGELKNNKFNGTGKYNYKDGRNYSGNFRDNKMHGKGIFTWANKQRYDGEYVNGEKEGYGTFDWMDGQLYKGDWKAGKQHGNGVFVDKEGKERKGKWVNGKCVEIDK